jgi:hypothetical protein
VILHRRLPRRSGLEERCLGIPSVVSFFISKSCWVAMAELSLRKNTEFSSREIVYGPATTKPIGRTYPERSSTSRKNGSTEVLEMEERNGGKGVAKREWEEKETLESRSEKGTRR